MSIWKDKQGLLHDDMDGAALELPSWPDGLTELTDEEAAVAQAPTTEQLAADVRAQRDALLSACDWTQVGDAPLTAAQVTAWKTYRQALRDLTAQAGFPKAITWPEAPSDD